MFDTVQTFPCPKCTAIVSTSSETCKKCGHEIGAEQARELAEQERFLIGAESDAEHAKYLSSTGLALYGLMLLAVLWFARFDVWKVGPKVARSDAGNLLQVLLGIGTFVLLPVLVMAVRNLIVWKRTYGSRPLDHWRYEAARSTWKSAIQTFAALVVVYLLADVAPLVALIFSR